LRDIDPLGWDGELDALRPDAVWRQCSRVPDRPPRCRIYENYYFGFRGFSEVRLRGERGVRLDRQIG
jgi:hypothetical protein